MSFLGATSRTVCATTSVANPPGRHEGHIKWQTQDSQRNTLSCHATQHSLLPPNATLSLAMQRNTHTHSLSLSCHPTHHVSNGLLNSSASPDYSRVSLTRPAPTQASHNKISSAGTWCVGRRSVRTLWEEEERSWETGNGRAKGLLRSLHDVSLALLRIIALYR